MFTPKRNDRVLVFLSCMVLAAGAARAQTTYYVDDDGSSSTCTGWGDACPDLQTALGLAGGGDQIWVSVLASMSRVVIRTSSSALRTEPEST